MGYRIDHEPLAAATAWRLAARQHGVVSRNQLVVLGLHPQAVKHRLNRGRLHRIGVGVYAVGRPDVTRHGRWMAAILSCGPEAVLSHESAAALWGIRRLAEGKEKRQGIDVCVPAATRRRRDGVRIHRSSRLGPAHCVEWERVPVTSPWRTLIDLASLLTVSQLEAAVNEADKLGLVDPESLRSFLAHVPRLPGAAALRRLLDRSTFRLTDSELERRFLRLVRSAGLPQPVTGIRLNGHRVDFFWPELRLVVETDGLRYHRTPAQQARDRRRDQDHSAAGLTTLRFTHSQIAFEADRAAAILVRVAKRSPTHG